MGRCVKEREGVYERGWCVREVKKREGRKKGVCVNYCTSLLHTDSCLTHD